MKRKHNISYKNQNNAKKLKYKFPDDIINKGKIIFAGVVQWQNVSFPS